MKILHLLPALTKGGGERVAVDLANEAVRRGHTVSMVAGFPVDPAALADQLSASVDLRFVNENVPGRLAKFRNVGPWVKREWEWLSGHDVVHAHMTYGGYVAGAIRSRRRRLRLAAPAVVETCHSVGMPMSPLMRRFYAHSSANRDGFAVMARDDFWEGFRARHADMPSDLILNGVSPPRVVGDDEARAWRRSVGISDDVRIAAGTVGVLRPERRPLDFVTLFARLADRLGPDAHFLLGGGGVMMDQVRDAVAAAGMAGRIHLPGMIREPAVALAGMEIYLTLNVGAVTGIAALEAAMAGLPLLALQAQADHVPGDADWIWSSADLDALADRAASLAGNDGARAELAHRQQVYARAHHGVEAMARAYESLYEAAIAAARRNGARLKS